MRSDDAALGIGQLADDTGASLRQLRYWEHHGLLPATRTPAGQRRFAPGSVETVRRIQLLLNTGMPIVVVAKVLPCFTDHGHTLDPCVSDYLRTHLTAVSQRIRALDKQRDITEYLAKLVSR